MFRFFSKRIAFICALSVFCASFVFAEENQIPKDSSFRVNVNHGLSFAALVLPHHSLRNSKSLHTWPFFAFAMPIGWNSSVRLQKDLGLISLKGLASGDMTFIGLGFKADASLELIHLLEIGAEANVNSAINYGDYVTFMGVYNPSKKDFSQDIFMTEFAYGTKYHASLSIPLLAVLPKSDWTKIILRPNASLSYSAYTGAEDGEVWKAGNDYMINGYRYQFGGTLIYMLPFEHFPMAMFASNVSGFVHPSDFDSAYDDYDPSFKKIGFTPMLSLKFGDKWGGMLMANFARDRVYKNYHYESGEELLQKRTGSEWTLKLVMAVLTRKF